MRETTSEKKLIDSPRLETVVFMVFMLCIIRLSVPCVSFSAKRKGEDVRGRATNLPSNYPSLQHGHDILRRGVDVHARQQDHDGEEDEQQRHLLSLGGNFRDVILRRKLGRALADEHVQTPRQRQAGRDDPEAQTEVHAQRGRTQRAASETRLRHAPAVDLTHGKHVQRLRNQAAPEACFFGA